MDDMKITWWGTSDMQWMPDGTVVHRTSTSEAPVPKTTIYEAGWAGSPLPSWLTQAAQECAVRLPATLN